MKKETNKKGTMKKQFLFWRDVNKRVREECTIEANNLDEATQEEKVIVIIYGHTKQSLEDEMPTLK
jgi:hypothetical protein